METGNVKLELDWVMTETDRVNGISIHTTSIAKINGGWLLKIKDPIINGTSITDVKINVVFIPDPSHVLFVNHDKDDA